MKKQHHLLIILAFLCTTVNTSFAQVKFNLVYDFEKEHYIFSIIPEVDYLDPQNITGTGQLTIKVPTNNFEVVNLENVDQAFSWQANSRTNSPDEDPDFDYISFSMMNPGVAKPEYKAGKELVIFTFENAYGCTGDVYLVDNASDNFMPPNSESVNIGNTLTVFGAGGDAYAGAYQSFLANCALTSTTEVEEITEFSVYPNPVVDFVNVDVYWESFSEDAILKIADAQGKELFTKEITLANGPNEFAFDVTHFAAGVYWVEISGEDWHLNLDRFFKGN